MADGDGDGGGLVVPPPPLRVGEHFPILLGVISIVVFTSLLVIISNKFDRTNGALTISILIVLTFCGTVSFCLFFTVPQDATTAAISGGLVSALGAIVAYWLGKPNPPANGPPP